MTTRPRRERPELGCLIACLVLTSCGATRPEPAPPVPTVDGPIDAGAMVTLVTGPCFGRCEVREVALFADGTLVIRQNGAPDERRAVDRGVLSAVTQAFADAAFFELEEGGYRPSRAVSSGGTYDFADRVVCSDTAHSRIRYDDGTRARTLETDHCEPTPLTRLEERLDALLGLQ